MRASRRRLVMVAMVLAVAGTGLTPVAVAVAASPSLWVTGRQIHPPVPPVIIDGHTLVPLRAVAEALGAEVTWFPEWQGVRVVLGTRRVQLVVGQHEAWVDGQLVPLGTPARIVGDRTMVPLRFIAEAMGSFVAWDHRGPAIHLSTNPHHLPAGGVALSAAPVSQFANADARLQLLEPSSGLVGTDLRLRLAGRVPDPAYAGVWVRIYAVAPAFAGGLVPHWQTLQSYLLDPQAPAESSTIPLTERQFEVYLWFDEPGHYIVILSVIDGQGMGWGTHWFRVVNWSREARYLVPTYGGELYEADSHHPDVYALARQLTVGRQGREAVLAIHDWVAGNVQYDLERLAQIRAAEAGQGETNLPRWQASDLLHLRRGVCWHYSVLAAALLRATGFRARVVTGDALLPGDETELHAWNQVWVDGRWLTFDATWNAGYIRDGRFVPKLSHDYFDLPEEVFARTHRADTAPRPVGP